MIKPDLDSLPPALRLRAEGILTHSRMSLRRLGLNSPVDDPELLSFLEYAGRQGVGAEAFATDSLVEVPLELIVGGNQDTVSSEYVLYYFEHGPGEPRRGHEPLLWRQASGGLIVLNGHHRWTAGYFAGWPTLDALIIERPTEPERNH